MMLVPVRVGPSAIDGMGLFAVAPIPSGTPVWRRVEGFDRSLGADVVASWPPSAQQHVRHYGYFDRETGHWMLGGDLSIFMNHSPRPNTGAPGVEGAAPVTVSLRDIAAGEELTCDYHAFDAGSKPVK